MTGSRVRWLTLSFILGSGLPNFSQSPHSEEAESPLRITVRVYNSARLPAGQLARAEAQATVLLHDAGVETIWLDCTVVAADTQNDPACTQPFRGTDLALALLDRLPSRVPAVGKTTLGFSVVPGVGFGHNAYVSVDRAQQLAQDDKISLEAVLGSAAAHEIGHLLLVSNGHSVSGLMRAEWDTQDLRRVAQGSLLFTAQESARMRVSVLARQQGSR